MFTQNVQVKILSQCPPPFAAGKKQLDTNLGEEGDGLAALAGAPRAADPVGVGLDVLGHVVVEDEGDVLDVDASTRHVRGHEDVL